MMEVEQKAEKGEGKKQNIISLDWVIGVGILDVVKLCLFWLGFQRLFDFIHCCIWWRIE
jgi:hypothetical protein